jgi:hypothetical protein
MTIPESYWQLSEKIRELLRWLKSNPNNGLEWRNKYNEWKESVNKQNRIIDQLEGRFSIPE